MIRDSFSRSNLQKASRLFALSAAAIVGSAVNASGIEDAEGWLRAYYSDYPIGGGWSVSKVAAGGEEVAVYVAVPPGQAASIARHPVERQLRILAGVACPSKLEKVWTLLPPDGDVVLHPAAGGKVFSDVSCRRHGG